MSRINNANSDKFKAVFSNVPIPEDRTSVLNLESFNNYVRSIILPDYSMELIESRFLGQTRRQPISQSNDNLSQITIEFFVDEDMENYKALFDWMKNLRASCKMKGAESIGKSYIHSLNVISLDNENRKTNTFIFKRCWLINLSSLSLVFGSSEQLQYTATFQFDEFDIEATTKTLNN